MGKSRKKRSKISKSKGDDDMGTVLCLEKHKKVFKPANIFEMITDPIKRQQTYNYYNNKYQETEEEKEIFEQSKLRRTRKDD